MAVELKNVVYLKTWAGLIKNIGLITKMRGANEPTAV
jgi:hypothetical protein